MARRAAALALEGPQARRVVRQGPVHAPGAPEDAARPSEERRLRASMDDGVEAILRRDHADCVRGARAHGVEAGRADHGVPPAIVDVQVREESPEQQKRQIKVLHDTHEEVRRRQELVHAPPVRLGARRAHVRGRLRPVPGFRVENAVALGGPLAPPARAPREAAELLEREAARAPAEPPPRRAGAERRAAEHVLVLVVGPRARPRVLQQRRAARLARLLALVAARRAPVPVARQRPRDRLAHEGDDELALRAGRAQHLCERRPARMHLARVRHVLQHGADRDAGVLVLMIVRNAAARRVGLAAHGSKAARQQQYGDERRHSCLPNCGA